MQDSGGLTSSSTLTVTIQGTNDAPVVVAQSTIATGTVTEDVDTDADTAGVQTQTTGTIAFNDVDTIDVVTARLDGTLSSPHTTKAGSYGTLVLGTVDHNSSTNAGSVDWTYNLDNTNLAVQALAVNETRTDTFTVILDDGNGGTVQQTVTITINGTNDAPVITAGTTATGTVTEDVDTDVVTDGVQTQTTGTIAFKDVDTSDVVTARLGMTEGETPEPITTKDSSYGTLVLGTVIHSNTDNAGSVDWTYTLDNVKAQELAAGQSITETFTVTLDDGNGGTVEQIVTITIKGSNDVPVITALDVAGMITEGSVLTDSGSIIFADVDLSDRPTASAEVQSVTAMLADGETALVLSEVQDTAIKNAFTISAAENNTNNGTINWTYSITETALDFLAQGEVVTAVFTITVDDGKGGTAVKDVTITITGTNDAPVITVGSGDSHAAVLDETNAILTTTGTLTVTDVDLTDTVTASVSAVAVAATYDGPLPPADALKDLLTVTSGAIAADPGTAGNLTWTFDSGSASAFDFLPANETLVLTYTISVADGKGGTDSHDVTITIKGTDDQPVVVLGSTDPVVFKPRGEDVALFTGVSLSDPDHGELLIKAMISLDPLTAIDNFFGDIFETIYAVSTDHATVAGNTITVGATQFTFSGNNTEGPITISGSGTEAEYELALQTLRYTNSHPDAVIGDRKITLVVYDDGTPEADGNNILASDPVEVTVNVKWTPVVDLAGTNAADRNYTTTYVEKQPTSTFISSPQGSVYDQNGLIYQLTITLTNPLDGTEGSDEKLLISAAKITELGGYGIKVDVEGNHSITLTSWNFTESTADTAGRSTSDFQIGLRAIEFINDSASPTENVQMMTG